MSPHTESDSRPAVTGRRERDCREPTKCRDCGKAILWVLWPQSGKKMPINAEPRSPTFGQVLVSYSPSTNQLLAQVAKYGDPRERKLYESHFATCTGKRATEMRRNRPPQGSARRAG
jgi:hypothetical protein